MDLRKDEANCGACGQICEADEVCDFGRCVAAPCPEGRTSCNGRCVDTQRNVNHCGECNNACEDGKVCTQGRCGDSCGGELENCGGSCVDLSKDRENCGTCGKACGEGEFCTRGACSGDCSEGEMLCGESCIDTSSDEQNCGGCGIACEAGMQCVNGACACPEGQTACDGTCIDTTSDPENCGGCNLRCSGDVPYATQAVCENSACVLTCVAGRGDCDGIASNGCETDLYSNDVANCGACGNDCEAAPHVNGAICLTGVCYITPDGCDYGWHDGNGDPDDGCEAYTLEDPRFCGVMSSSLRNCEELANTVDPYCDDGACKYGCKDGWADCNRDPDDGCEQEVASDVFNCGGCGITCDPGGACVDGECLPDFEIANWPLPAQPLEPNYVADAETVTDRTTGLVWERQLLDAKFTWEAALQHCSRYGSGWRLPTAIELLSIVDTTRQGPAVVTNVFEFTKAEAFWTATSNAANSSQAWVVNFSSGATAVASKTTSYLARCVREGTNAFRGERFAIDGDVVVDRKTGLMWERNPLPSTMNWTVAPQSCASSRLYGKDDWRVPTKLELETLVDRRRTSPMIDTDVFPSVTGTYFWTSTPLANSGTNAWRVRFSDGTSSSTTRTTGHNVICVRNAED